MVDDYAERTYVFNSGRFKISDNAQFIIHPDRTREIQNFSIVPREDDNFDFEGGGITADVGNDIWEPEIDPSGIGRTVDIKFVGTVPDRTYTLNDYTDDQVTVSSWALSPGPGDIQKLLDVSQQLWDDGVTKLLVDYKGRVDDADDRHIDIRSPQAGIVHELAVHAPGAVVTPGEAIMQIVPINDALTPELRLAPQDIDQVAVGQDVTLRFSAFSQRTTPELNGRVTKIAADLIVDQRTGQSYYRLRVSIPVAEWARLDDLTPVTGMPVEAFVQTGERTALAYLTKPLADQVVRAFKEE